MFDNKAISFLALLNLFQDSDSDEAAIIPVLNILADEVPLRTESTHLLPRCNIQLTDLVCKDDIDLKSIPNLTLTLVDHNVPADSDTWLDQYVVEVIDHRVNSRHDDEDRVISITREMVGSCCTLVARQILDKHLEILDHRLVKLLLGELPLPISFSVSHFAYFLCLSGSAWMLVCYMCNVAQQNRHQLTEGWLCAT